MHSITTSSEINSGASREGFLNSLTLFIKIFHILLNVLLFYGGVSAGFQRVSAAPETGDPNPCV